MAKTVRMETSMVEDSGIAYQHGEIVQIEIDAEADRWVEKGAASFVDDGDKPKHFYPPRRRSRPVVEEPKPVNGKGGKGGKGGKEDADA